MDAASAPLASSAASRAASAACGPLPTGTRMRWGGPNVRPPMIATSQSGSSRTAASDALCSGLVPRQPRMISEALISEAVWRMALPTSSPWQTIHPANTLACRATSTAAASTGHAAGSTVVCGSSGLRLRTTCRNTTPVWRAAATRTAISARAVARAGFATERTTGRRRPGGRSKAITLLPEEALPLPSPVIESHNISMSPQSGSDSSRRPHGRCGARRSDSIILY